MPNLYSPHSYLGMTALLLALAQVGGGEGHSPAPNTLIGRTSSSSSSSCGTAVTAETCTAEAVLLSFSPAAHTLFGLDLMPKLIRVSGERFVESSKKGPQLSGP